MKGQEKYDLSSRQNTIIDCNRAIQIKKKENLQKISGFINYRYEESLDFVMT